MISAEEAYRLTNELGQKGINRIQNKINKKIKRQIRRGRYSLSVYQECFTDNEICELILEYYRNMGYSARIKPVSYNIYTKYYELFVSWQNPQNVNGVAFEAQDEENENPES